MSRWFSKGRIKKKWWNNGITEVLQAKCPIGFTEGRLPLSQEHKEKIGQFGKGKHWWNNGLINVFQQNVQMNLNLEKYIIKNIKYTSNLFVISFNYEKDYFGY